MTAGIVAAQGAPPTVTVTMTAKQITLQGAEALQGGPTRFALRSGDKRDHTFTIAALKPGVTFAEFERVLGRARGPEPVAKVVTFEGGGQSRAVTLSLRPGVTDVALDTSGDDPRRFPRASFSVGAAQGTAVAPRPRAEVRLKNFRFEGCPHAPARGHRPLPQRRPQPTFHGHLPAQAGRRRPRRGPRDPGQRRACSRTLVGRPAQRAPERALARAGHDQELTFRRAGTYMLVCFFETRGKGHNERGMYRAVRVR